MNTAAQIIFTPVVTLALWTLTVLLLVPIARFRAGHAGRVTLHDFKVGESAKVPADVSVPNRVFMNLLEVPVLFYVACLVAFVTGHVDDTTMAISWAYVGLRVLHSLIYLSYNNVIHRLSAFAISNFVVVGLWLRLGWQLLR